MYCCVRNMWVAKAIIKMACEIRLKWIEEMLPLLKNVDLMLLANIKPDEKEEGRKRQPEEKLEKEDLEKEKQNEADKLNSARERYLKRKKVES